MSHIQQHTTASRAQLGAARDQLNITANHHDPAAVHDAVYALEAIVTDVHGGRPTGCTTCQQ